MLQQNHYLNRSRRKHSVKYLKITTDRYRDKQNRGFVNRNMFQCPAYNSSAHHDKRVVPIPAQHIQRQFGVELP